MSGLELRGGPKTVIGMIHLQPLPGTPFHEPGSLQQIIDRAVRSARALRDGGADGCLVQTVDRVYRVDDESDPTRTAAMTLVVQAVAQAVGPDFHVGVQMMVNAVRASLGVSRVAGGSFVRATAVVGATLGAHGMVTADPLGVQEYRVKINAGDIRIIADVDTMHFQWFGGDRSTGAVARGAALVGADAVAVGAPDEERTLAMVQSVRVAAPELPVILAGYTNHANAARLLAAADGAFVGTCLERGGWGGEIDVERVGRYVDLVRALDG
jgi:membrane complex biogenesis BtpA family protein